MRTIKYSFTSSSTWCIEFMARGSMDYAKIRSRGAGFRRFGLVAKFSSRKSELEGMELGSLA